MQKGTCAEVSLLPRHGSPCAEGRAVAQWSIAVIDVLVMTSSIVLVAIVARVCHDDDALPALAAGPVGYWAST